MVEPYFLRSSWDEPDPKEFRRCAERRPTARDTPSLSAYDHFAVMHFAQLTYRESLRDTEACLNSRSSVLYHAGIRGTVKRSIWPTLSISS